MRILMHQHCQFFVLSEQTKHLTYENSPKNAAIICTNLLFPINIVFLQLPLYLQHFVYLACKLKYREGSVCISARKEIV